MEDLKLAQLGLRNNIYRKRLEAFESSRNQSEPLINKLITMLQERRASSSSIDLSTSAVDEMLLPLLEIERAMPIDPENYIPPSCYDVLITDISDKDLEQVAKEFDISQYGAAENPSSTPSRGIFYGENLRLFIPLTVERKGKSIWVMFLYDTGSPYTFLRTETWRALGVEGVVDIPSSTNVKIADVVLPVSKSAGHFENIDLLGQNFLAMANLKIVIDYRLKEVALVSSQHV